MKNIIFIDSFDKCCTARSNNLESVLAYPKKYGNEQIIDH